MEQDIFNDRRRAKRTDTALDVFVKGEGWRQRATANCISRRGARIAIQSDMYLLGQRLSVVFVQTKLKNVVEIRTYSAIVVRQEADGLAIQFCWSPQTERLIGDQYETKRGV